MFHNLDKNEEYKEFQQFKEKVDKLRKEHLMPISCRVGKSIIQMSEKVEFETKLKALQDEAKKINETLLELLEQVRMKTKDLIKQEFIDFFKKYPPDEFNKYKDENLKSAKIMELIDKTVFSIKFPDIKKLIEKISIESLFYDLTFQDFSDDKLLKEFSAKKIMEENDINTIVAMKKAFETKI